MSLGCSQSTGFALMQAMRDIVAKCLVKDPSKRPTAAQLLDHKFFKVDIASMFSSIARALRLLHSMHDMAFPGISRSSLCQGLYLSEVAPCAGATNNH